MDFNIRTSTRGFFAIMKDRILIVNDLKAGDAEIINFSPHGTSDHHIIFSFLSKKYDLYVSGYDTLPNPDGFACSIAQCVLEDRLHRPLPRPIIGLPDNEWMYSLSTLREYDAIIAANDGIESDCLLANVPCVKAHPVNLSHVDEAICEVEPDVSDVIFTNHSIHDVGQGENMRVIHDAGLRLGVYYFPHQAGEIDKWQMDGIFLFEVQRWEKYVNMVASSFGGSNINRGPLGVGKVAVFAAYNRKISIGYPMQYQKILYPELTSFDLEVLRNYCLKLKSKSFYDECGCKAKERLPILDMENYRDLVVNFVDMVISNERI